MSLTDANGFFEFGGGSNLRTGTNPPYALTDFLTAYPQFGNNAQGVAMVPSTVVQTFINLANASLQQSRWHSAWQIAMGWYVAHFCTMFLQGTADPNSGAAAVLEAGRAQGFITSESVGDVSASQNPVLPGMDAWAAWQLTVYGQQLLTMGRMVGKGGMFIQ